MIKSIEEFKARVSQTQGVSESVPGLVDGSIHLNMMAGGDCILVTQLL